MLNQFTKRLLLLSPLLALCVSSYCRADSPSFDWRCMNTYQWSSEINFSVGNVVRYKGLEYKAMRQNTGESPDKHSGQNGSWQLLGTCAVDAQVTCDFNGDGKLDLAKGFPAADLISGKSNSGIPGVTALENAGEVTVTYGSTSKDKSADQVWDQNGLGMFAYARANAIFGYTLSAGDFNNDSFCDLAIGAPGFSLKQGHNEGSRGSINVLYGSPNGLTIIVLGENGRPVNPYDAQRFDQDSPNVPGEAESGDDFSRALATGDLNGDGYDDIVVGVQNEGTSLVPQMGYLYSVGYINIFYGSKHGIQTTSPKVQGYFKNISGVPNTEVAQNDSFGRAILLEDFDHDGFDDLVVSAPGDNGKGKVSLFRGSKTGIDKTSRIDLTLDDFPDTKPANLPDFGGALYKGDFNGDGYTDLEIWYSRNSAEIPTVKIFGSATGLVLNH